MQVVYTNANNESEMVYVEIMCAIIIGNFFEIATTNTFNSLRHAISQWMRGFPSRFEVKMFQILLQECTLIHNNKTNMCGAFEQNIFKNKYLIFKTKYLRIMTYRLETTIPPDVSNYIARVYTEQKLTNMFCSFEQNI